MYEVGQCFSWYLSVTNWILIKTNHMLYVCNSTTSLCVMMYVHLVCMDVLGSEQVSK